MKKPAWNNIQTVLLDMDGTLLDLHFDNYFWLKHMPESYARQYNLSFEQAEQTLHGLYRAIEGTMNWYCVDYWSEQLNMDVMLLKEQVKHLIQLHPYVIEFLEFLKINHKKRILVTNAHPKSIEIKFNNTVLGNHLDQVISSHDLGLPKEDPAFWEKLHQVVDYQPENSLLIDDNQSVLSSAQTAGIAYLLAIAKPDSKLQEKQFDDFPAINHFNELLSQND